MKGLSLTVDLGDRSYEIRIEAGVLDAVGGAVRSLFEGEPKVVIVTDSGVAPFYLERTQASLRAAGFDVWEIEFPAGEGSKNLGTLSQIYDRLLALPADRSTILVALGGGVVGDLTGFAAATLLRGVPFVQVPTSLLAQVDASVGGKTGVNHVRGKNLIGAFCQPRMVLIDPTTLGTLPVREYVAGLAEVVKYGASLDAAFFGELESGVAALQAQDSDLLADVIHRCCGLKAKVVAKDERESGRRAILNFGHTVAHAVEALTGYDRFLHGEAVSIGMVAAARLSAKLGLIPAEHEERLRVLLARFGLPTEIPSGLNPSEIVTAIESDKKASAGAIRFVVLKGIGEAGFESLSARRIVELVT